MKLRLIWMALIMIMATTQAEAGIFGPKNEGKKVAIKAQKNSVKLGKKNMKGMKKASKVVNKRLSGL